MSGASKDFEAEPIELQHSRDREERPLVDTQKPRRYGRGVPPALATTLEAQRCARGNGSKKWGQGKG
jgi:hypothetical protein